MFSTIETHPFHQFPHTPVYLIRLRPDHLCPLPPQGRPPRGCLAFIPEVAPGGLSIRTRLLEAQGEND